MGEEMEKRETLEDYGDRIARATRKLMMDKLDDDVIGCLTDSHIIFGKACAMEAVTTAYREMDEYRKIDGNAAALDDGWRPPEGWVLVPREATGAMAAAYYDALPYTPGTESWAMASYPAFARLWRDALAAAPSPPTPNGSDGR